LHNAKAFWSFDALCQLLFSTLSRLKSSPLNLERAQTREKGSGDAKKFSKKLGTSFATCFAEMTFTEFSIIYLSIGAPFGVYYFFNYSSDNRSFSVWLKTIGVVFFWCAYAVLLNFGRSQKNTNVQSNSDLIAENEIQKAERSLLASYSEISRDGKIVSFFEFRETVERYIGLTSTLGVSVNSADFNNELFMIAERKNHDLLLANRCLQRKNLLRLKAHQLQTRNDFLRIFENLFKSNSQASNFEKTLSAAILLTDSLDDADGATALNQIKRKIERQNSSAAPSKKEVWNTLQPDQIRVLPAQSSILNLVMKKPD
jgi:hypothetical protein